jgi:hypothetical protein
MPSFRTASTEPCPAMIPPVARRLTPEETALLDLAHLLRPPVPPIQPEAPDGPASIWQTLARFEIDRIKGQAPPAPVIRGSAKIAEPAGGQIGERPPDIIAGIEFLCSAIELRPAALQQNTGHPGTVQFSCERDPGGSVEIDDNVVSVAVGSSSPSAMPWIRTYWPVAQPSAK